MNQPLSRPSTIFGDRLLGLALVAGDGLERRALLVDHVGSGTSSRVRYFGLAKAMCTATSWASSGVAAGELDEHAR